MSSWLWSSVAKRSLDKAAVVNLAAVHLSGGDALLVTTDPANPATRPRFSKSHTSRISATACQNRLRVLFRMADKHDKQAAAQQAVDVLHEISTILVGEIVCSGGDSTDLSRTAILTVEHFPSASQ